LANASVRVKRTRYGVMAYNINDMYVGRSLDCYGEYVPGQMSLLSQLAPSGSIALDVGANIGAITLVNFCLDLLFRETASRPRFLLRCRVRGLNSRPRVYKSDAHGIIGHWLRPTRRCAWRSNAVIFL
jgi:hypothetical protein